MHRCSVPPTLVISLVATGDRYEGEWEQGRENGVGTYIAVDGSTFYGFWADGKMHGEGVSCRPPLGTAAEQLSTPTWRSRLSLSTDLHQPGGWQVYKPATADNQRAEVMFMREYNHGKLVKETVLRVKDFDYHRKELKRDQRARKSEKRQAARVGSQSLGLCSLSLRLLVLEICSSTIQHCRRCWRPLDRARPSTRGTAAMT